MSWNDPKEKALHPLVSFKGCLFRLIVLGREGNTPQRTIHPISFKGEYPAKDPQKKQSKTSILWFPLRESVPVIGLGSTGEYSAKDHPSYFLQRERQGMS